MFDSNPVLLFLLLGAAAVIIFYIFKLAHDKQMLLKQISTSLVGNNLDVDSTDPTQVQKALTMSQYLGLSKKEIVQKTNIQYPVKHKEFYDSLLLTFPNNEVEEVHKQILVKTLPGDDETDEVNVVSRILKITKADATAMVVIDEYASRNLATVKIFHSKDTQFKYNTILALAKKAKWVAPRNNTPQILNVKRLSKSKDGLYTTESHSFLTLMDPDFLNKSYKIRPMTVEGSTINLKATEAVNVALACLKAQQNVYIVGATNTCKTTLCEYILSRASKEVKEIKDIFYLNADSLVTIFSESFEAQSKTIFGELPFKETESTYVDNTAKLHCFYCDEFQEVLKIGSPTVTNVLTSLDGTAKRLNKTVYLTCLNEMEMDEVDPMAFRSGRAGLIIYLDPLPKKEALELADFIADNLPITKKLDMPKVNKIIEEDSKLTETSEIYAPKGTAAAGDIYNSVNTAEVLAIVDAIKNPNKPKKQPPVNLDEVTIASSN